MVRKESPALAAETPRTIAEITAALTTRFIILPFARLRLNCTVYDPDRINCISIWPQRTETNGAKIVAITVRSEMRLHAVSARVDCVTRDAVCAFFLSRRSGSASRIMRCGCGNDAREGA